jgi:hypothetical protein
MKSHTHRCPICWSNWECQDAECGEGIIETKYDMQFLTDCGIEKQERSRECDDCLSDPDRHLSSAPAFDDYKFRDNM